MWRILQVFRFAIVCSIFQRICSGQYEPARQLAEDTLTRCRRVLGDDHPLTLVSTHILATILRELKQYEPARQLGEGALARMHRVLGDDRPGTLRAATQLTATLRELGQHEQSRQLAEDTLPACTGSYATTTPTPCAQPTTSPLYSRI